FIWEHMETVNQILTHIKHSGRTFSGPKMAIVAPEFVILSQQCTYTGQQPEPSKVAKIQDWQPCKSLTKVQAFLG
ncbi:hypothetical protein DACRYDRAFT_30284, partial [Dacryopinax primogenitus]